MGETEVRDLVEVSSGAISMDDFYGASSFPEPVTLGDCDPAWGGFYMGTISASGASYYLFVAPNATGFTQAEWKDARTCTGGASSLNDGFANTYPALANFTHPAGNFAATRTISGFSDWYLPAINELQVIYDNGATIFNGPLPSGERFCSGSYWSSTEVTATFTCYMRFTTGVRCENNKTRECCARAVRRVPI
jgi:hypothetical protein